MGDAAVKELLSKYENLMSKSGSKGKGKSSQNVRQRMSVSPNANYRIRMNVYLANGGQTCMSLAEVRNGRFLCSDIKF